MCSRKKKKTFECEHCQKLCASQKGLNLHIRMAHKERRPLKHDYCQKLHITDKIKERIRSQQIGHSGRQILPFPDFSFAEFAINELIQEHARNQQGKEAQKRGRSSTEEYTDFNARTEHAKELIKSQQESMNVAEKIGQNNKPKYYKKAPSSKQQRIHTNYQQSSKKPDQRKLEPCKQEYFKEFTISEEVKRKIRCQSLHGRIPRIITSLHDRSAGVDLTPPESNDTNSSVGQQNIVSRIGGNPPPKQSHYSEVFRIDSPNSVMPPESSDKNVAAVQQKPLVSNRVCTPQHSQPKHSYYAEVPRIDIPVSVKALESNDKELATRGQQTVAKRGHPPKHSYYTEIARIDLVKQHMQLSQQGKAAENAGGGESVKQDYCSRYPAATEQVKEHIKSQPLKQDYCNKFTVTDQVKERLLSQQRGGQKVGSQSHTSFAVRNEQTKQHVQTQHIQAAQVHTPQERAAQKRGHSFRQDYFNKFDITEHLQTLQGRVSQKGGRPTTTQEYAEFSLRTEQTKQLIQSQQRQPPQKAGQTFQQDYYNKFTVPAQDSQPGRMADTRLTCGEQPYMHNVYPNFSTRTEQPKQCVQSQPRVAQKERPSFEQEYHKEFFALTEQVKEHLQSHQERDRPNRQAFAPEYVDFALRTEQTRRLIQSQQGVSQDYYKDFAINEQLKEHSRQHGREDLLYQCKQCKVRFEHLRQFRTHMCCIEDLTCRQGSCSHSGT